MTNSIKTLSRVESLKGPIDLLNVGQMGTIVLPHLAIDQAVELVVHGEQDILLRLVQGEINHFMRIVFKIEQLDIVGLEDLIDGCRAVVVQGAEVAAEFVASVIHAANGRPLLGIWFGSGCLGQFFSGSNFPKNFFQPVSIHVRPHAVTVQGAVADGQSKIVVDMSKVEYISSAGLRSLAAVLVKCRDEGGDMKIAALNERVTRVFKIIGFDLLMSVTDTPEAAIADFSSGAAS